MNNIYKIKIIDSNLNIDWEKIDKANIDNYDWELPKQYDSFAQIVFVKNDGFYIRLVANESNPWCNARKDGDPVYLDSCLEAFISFDNKNYINFENNSKGIRLQGFGPDRFNRENLIETNKDSPVKAIRTNATWEILVFVSLNTITKVYENFDVGVFKKGYTFKGNFYKTGNDPKTHKSHYGMWNKINNSTPDFHRPEQFGTLIIE